MNHDISWTDLHQHSQQNLVDFLKVELDLAITLCGMAQDQADAARRAKLRGEVDEALRTVRHFADRIEDPTTRKSILDRAVELECRVEK
jgi:hypothetical protein